MLTNSTRARKFGMIALHNRPFERLGQNRNCPPAARTAAILLFLLFGTTAASRAQTAQEQTISGTVTDAQTKEGLPGATVSIPALHIGAITHANGQYSILKVPAGTYKVEAKLVGYRTIVQDVSVAAAESATSNFLLTIAPVGGQEVVIKGLTGEVDAKKLGNVIGYVSGASVAAANTPAAIDAIEGRVPGVVVQKNSGAVGTGSYITIRGRHTISGSSEPLYVIDGTIVDNSTMVDVWGQNGSVQLSNRAIDIGPENIESIQILKGASAAAIYGSLAANGVVLITTKRGNVMGADRPATVSYVSSYESDQRVGSYPLQTTYGQGNGGVKKYTNLSWGAKLPSDTTVYNQANVPFRTAGSNIQSITVSGGIPALTFLVNGTLSNLDGIVSNSSLVDRNLRLNLGANILDNLTVQSNSNYINRNNALPQEGSNTSGILLGALRTPPEFNNNITLNPDGTQHQFFSSYDNPIWTQQVNSFSSLESRFLHSTDVKWTALDWLVLDGRVGYDRYSLNDYEVLDPQSATTGKAGRITHVLNDVITTNLDFTATATWQPTDNVLLQLLAGGQTIWGDGSLEREQANNTTPFFSQLSSGANITALSSQVKTKTIGMFSQLTGTLFDRLALTAALRRDGSSVFGADNQYHYYPKFGLSYSMGSEKFMEGLKGTLDDVTIRAAYGEAGSPSLPGAYATNLLYSTFGLFDPWGRTPNSAGRNGFLGLRQAGGTDNDQFLYGNPNIRPEISIEREIGLDLAFWDRKITLQATYYHTNVNDMILNQPVAGSTGFDIVSKNAGTMWNEGFEYTLGITPIRTERFSWITSANYARNYNLVTSLPGSQFIPMFGFVGIQNVAMVGHPIGVFYGLGYVHNADGSVAMTDGKTADYFGNKYKNAPMIDPNPKVIGDPNPRYTISWRNDFTFEKDFNFGFLIDAVEGQQIWNGTKGTLYRFGTAGDTKDRGDPWVFQGQPVTDASGAAITRETYYRFYANSFSYGIEEPVIEDGSFLKLREISLGYNWHGLRDWKIETVAITFTARNLLTWTKYTGFDPELNNFGQSESRGFDYFTIPTARSYRLSIGLTY